MADPHHVFSAYCDICHEGSDWSEDEEDTQEWRREHFEEEHPDNPMVKQNTRIRRYPADEVPA